MSGIVKIFSIAAPVCRFRPVAWVRWICHLFLVCWAGCGQQLTLEQLMALIVMNCSLLDWRCLSAGRRWRCAKRFSLPRRRATALRRGGLA